MFGSGGNLAMAQRFAFESDLATILLGAGASVKIVTFKGMERGTTVLKSVWLAFGAFGTKHAIWALQVETLLGSTTLILARVKKSVDLLKTELVPVEGIEKKEYCVKPYGGIFVRVSEFSSI
uniref:Uncharacterized protein n=1 Tax=Physcomitrium patens TaxID=3218 RepID=A0A2K1JP21_PHYPA|nr:hypothetical protein PHYPA_015680 [Physcomitrium patens]